MLADPTPNKEFVTWLAKRAAAGERPDYYTEDLSQFADYKRRRLLQGTEGDIGRVDGAGLRQLLQVAEERLAARDASQQQAVAAARARREERLRAQAAEARESAPQGKTRYLGSVTAIIGEDYDENASEFEVRVTEILDREGMVHACALHADGSWCVGTPRPTGTATTTTVTGASSCSKSPTSSSLRGCST
jgi:hypothetical protein